MTKKIELENQINLIEARINQIANSEHYCYLKKKEKLKQKKSNWKKHN